jgi:hypothetical protein
MTLTRKRIGQSVSKESRHNGIEALCNGDHYNAI